MRSCKIIGLKVPWNEHLQKKVGGGASLKAVATSQDNLAAPGLLHVTLEAASKGCRGDFLHRHRFSCHHELSPTVRFDPLNVHQ